MSKTPPHRIQMPAPLTAADLSNDNSALTDTSPSVFGRGSPSVFDSVRSNAHHGGRRRSARQSFATQRTRRGSRATMIIHDDMTDIGDEGEVKLPTLVPGIRPAYSTPLPALPMAVLCIAMLSELLSANLCTPFILKMVEGFYLSSGYPKNSETEAEVGLWTGNLISVFFITQFFTSLLWSSIADRHGRRAVIVASMAGSAIALVIFGTSESLPEAICIRLVQGIFGGAVGVFRGSIRDITDDTNATRAYAVLGFSWGFGGVIGPILGGVFESPAENFAGTFLSQITLFQSFPYLLPTILAATVLLTGAIMACFLSWDGGVRGGSRITLPAEKDEPLQPAPETPARVASPVPSHRTAVPMPHPGRALLSPRDPREAEMAAGGAGYGTSVPHARRDSRASLGTAYGYGGIRSKHPTLAARAAENARKVSLATRRMSMEDDGPVEGAESSMTFAKKLLMANEENTFNINDLWVSAAVAQDTAVFEDDDYDYDDGTETEREDNDGDDNVGDTSRGDQSVNLLNSPEGSPMPSPSLLAPGQNSIGRRQNRNVSASLQRTLPGHRLSVNHGGRRFSTASGNLPAIFSNTGLRSPSIALAQDTPPATGDEDPFFSPGPGTRVPTIGGLSVITERPGQTSTVETSPLISPMHGLQVEKKPSTWNLLPWLMIIQYGLLALHNTTHDQIFLSFLTTQYKSGGIGLNPANFSVLIALMCLFQLVYQFWLYPRLGPPLGRFSHLQMFRLGCSMYLPSYFALPLLRAFASPDKSGGVFIMTLCTIVTAVRYCGGTLAYTSVMVLINAMSPPHVVGLANGLAQSTVSFARFFGPVIGGTLWSTAINGNPDGYAKPFYIVTAMAAVQLVTSWMIR